ncbi:type II toxin-antitoxin system MqsR family toxin [Stenotrophomonas maltophilia]|nr:type II toxin-antitoxin system MqsR family toxin [Stenotrophomonas maltophilia]
MRDDKCIFTSNAQAGYQELGFETKEQAIECILWLDPSEYRTTLEYEDGKFWDDYVAKIHCPATKTMRRVYIKLRIPSPSSVQHVVVTSFHAEKVIAP